MSEFNQTTTVSNNKLDNNLCMRLAEAIVDNFNKLFESSNIVYCIDFENATKILDIFLNNFYVTKDKTSESYDKSKKYFSKVLSCNFKFIKDKLDLSVIELKDNEKEAFMELFEDGPNKYWINFLFILMSYISFSKQSNKDININYSGMIDKLMKKIEEYNSLENSEESEESEELEESEESEESEDLDNPTKLMEQFSQNMDPQELLNQLTQQLPQKNENSNNIMKDLLGDIKGMLSGGQNLDTQNIMDLSKDLSVKYQEMIEKGTVNISDLFTGVIDLLNNPDAIGEEFNDLDTNNLPNPNDLIQQMSSDPNLKQAISMMGNMGNTDNKDGNPMAGLNMGGLNMGGLNMGMLSAMMSGMMNTPDASNSNVPKTVQELEKEIERLMTELEGEEGEEEGHQEGEQEGEQDKNNKSL